MKEDRLPDEGSRMTTFIFESKVLNQFKNIATREGKPMKDLIQDYMKDYIRVHGDGNPQFTIDHFAEPDFNICPAVFRNGDAWKKYMEKRTPKELEEIKNQIILIDKILGRHI